MPGRIEWKEKLEAERRETARRSKRRSTARKVASIFGGVVVWFILSHTITSKVPDPVVTVTRTFWVVIDPWFYQSIVYSIYRVLAGFAAGTVLGIPIGLMMGWKRIFRDFTFPVFETLRPMPPVSWVPLSILIFVTLEFSIMFIIFWGTFFVVALNAKLGVEQIDDSLFRAARCLGAGDAQIFRHVVLPGALPAIFTGLALGMGVSWITVVAAEMIAGEYGVGYMAWQSYSLIRYAEVILAMFTIGILGYGSSTAIRKAGDRFLAWKKVYLR